MVNNKYIVAVFRNRSYTYSFYNEMAKQGLKCYIVNTPRQNYVSCGISCKFNLKDLIIAKSIVEKYGKSFVGFFNSAS